MNEKLPSTKTMLQGVEIEVKGLVTQPGLNGLMGTIHAFNPNSGRYLVMVAEHGQVSLKPENLDFSLERARASATLNATNATSKGEYENNAEKTSKKKKSAGKRK